MFHNEANTRKTAPADSYFPNYNILKVRVIRGASVMDVPSTSRELVGMVPIATPPSRCTSINSGDDISNHRQRFGNCQQHRKHVSEVIRYKIEYKHNTLACWYASHTYTGTLPTYPNKFKRPNTSITNPIFGRPENKNKIPG
jgi:hypothetical protein